MIQQVFDESKQIYGAGKITAVLKERGYITSEKMARYFMQEMGLISIRQQGKYLPFSFRNHDNTRSVRAALLYFLEAFLHLAERRLPNK